MATNKKTQMSIINEEDIKEILKEKVKKGADNDIYN